MKQEPWNLNLAFGEADAKPVADALDYQPLREEASTVIDSGSGLMVKRDAKGQVISQTQTRDVFGARRPGAEPVQRLQPKPPRDADELIDELRSNSEELSRQIAYYESVKGSNPNQERIVSLKLEIAKLQAKLRPLEAELMELQAIPAPSDLIVQQLEAAQTRTQQLARESTERKLRNVIEEDLDLRFEDATNDDKRNILKTRKMAGTKNIIGRFWPRAITLEGLATHSTRIFDAIEQTIKFLKS